MLVDLIFPTLGEGTAWTGTFDEWLLANDALSDETVAEVRAALASPDRETGLMGGGAEVPWLLRVHEEDDDA